LFGLLSFVGRIYVLILPIVMGGVCNMVFMKLPVLNAWRFPMDARKTFRGKRVFGDNKTWKGLFGMVVFTALSGWLVWGVANARNLLRGAWLGFVWIIFELPNSFAKRQLNIPSGKNGGLLQTFFDQADSVFGIALLYRVVYPLTLREALGVFVLLTITHYLVNILLFYLKLKKQRG